MYVKNISINKLTASRIALTAVTILLFWVFGVSNTFAAKLVLSPTSGTFETGSVFDVNIYIDTEGEVINAVEVVVSFPPEKLQLVSPSIGQSIIGIWTSPPQFDNLVGRVSLQGGIPGGINASKGLLTKLTFRVKSTGNASLRFLDSSRTLLNDGKGTDALYNTVNAVFSLILPPPAGPIISSSTNPDQSKWYSEKNISLQWIESSNPDGYSYVLNGDPANHPDDIPEGQQNSVIYNNISDGTHVFHIKAIKNGKWGGLSHFTLNVDTTPPAEFPIKFLPSSRTSQTQPIIEFSTTDVTSGINHYELEVIPLQGKFQVDAASQPFFIEVQSPYVLPEMSLGTYNVVVRAFDNAGNYRDSTKRLEIVKPFFQFIAGEGLRFSNITVPWLWFWILALVLVICLVLVAWKMRKWHDGIDEQQKDHMLPEYIKKQLEELNEYRKKYGSRNPLVMIIIVLTMSALFCTGSVLANVVNLSPPIVTNISQNISNEEIFYIGGKTETPKTGIILYLQSVQTGEARSYRLASDDKGNWFYRHDTFLPSGEYILWAQSVAGDEYSPPTPQSKIVVYPMALQFGASRLSYEMLYLAMVIVLLVLLVFLTWYIVFHWANGKKKHKLFMKEVREAEESLRRGFAVLRRDIQAELAVIHRAGLTQELSDKEKAASQRLMSDLERIERYIGKEIWDVEKMDYEN